MSYAVLFSTVSALCVAGSMRLAACASPLLWLPLTSCEANCATVRYTHIQLTSYLHLASRWCATDLHYLTSKTDDLLEVRTEGILETPGSHEEEPESPDTSTRVPDCLQNLGELLKIAACVASKHKGDFHDAPDGLRDRRTKANECIHYGSALLDPVEERL